MASLRYDIRDDTLSYVSKVRNGGIESLGGFLAVRWSGNGDRVEGIFLHSCSVLLKQLEEALSDIGKSVSWDNLPLSLLVHTALIEVRGRWEAEHRSDREFQGLSRQVSRFVLGITIPSGMAKEVKSE